MLCLDDAYNFPVIDTNQSILIFSTALVTDTQSRYLFVRKLSTEQEETTPPFPIQTDTMWLVWAYCDSSNPGTSLAYHASSRSSAAVPVDFHEGPSPPLHHLDVQMLTRLTCILTLGPCLSSCNNAGACRKGQCECDVGFYGPACEHRDNSLELSKDLSLHWHLAPSLAQPVTLEATLVLRGYHCWAALGLRKDSAALMQAADYFIGQGGSAPASVQEFHSNTSDSHNWPIPNDEQSTILSSAAEFTANGDTIYRSLHKPRLSHIGMLHMYNICTYV